MAEQTNDDFNSVLLTVWQRCVQGSQMSEHEKKSALNYDIEALRDHLLTCDNTMYNQFYHDFQTVCSRLDDAGFYHRALTSFMHYEAPVASVSLKDHEIPFQKLTDKTPMSVDDECLYQRTNRRGLN